MNSSAPDRAFIAWVATVAMLVAAVPYLFGLAMTPSGRLFQGNTILAPGDPNVYYSYIEQARHGAVMMRDVFTGEPQAATLWQPVWLLLGWVANIFHLTTPAVFALGRLVSVLVFAATVWWAAGWIWPERTARRVATMLVLGGSGLGGIVAWVGRMNFGAMVQLPPDLWVSEMIPVLSSWATPHFLLVTSGFLFVLVALERSWQEKSWRLIGWAGLVSLLTLSIHPFHALTWVGIWVGLTLWRWVTTKIFPLAYVIRWVAVLGMSLPAIIYYLVGLLSDPIVQGRAVQNINVTPSWWKVLVSLGGLGIFAVLGARRKHQEKNQQLAWLAAWAVVQLVVIFLPFNGQRRLMQAMILPFALLSVPMLVGFWQRWGRIRLQKIFLVAGLTGLLGSTTIISGAWIVRDYYQERQGRDHWEYFLSPEYQQLFSYLKGNVGTQQPILASGWDSVLIGGFTARTVVAGHPIETLNYDEKMAAIRSFFQTPDRQKQSGIIGRYGACYILDGPRERAYGGGFAPDEWANLNISWSGPTMTLYRLTDCRVPAT